MNLKKSLENRIRGWLPKAPTITAKTTTNAPNEQKTKPKTTSGPRLSYFIIFAILWILLAVLNISTRQYTTAITYFGGSVAIILVAFAYFKLKIRPRIIIGSILIATGILFALFDGLAEGIFGFPAIFLAPLFSVGAGPYAIGIAVFVVLVIVGVSLSLEGVSLKQLLTKKQILPYVVVAILLFLTGLAIVSGIVVDYVIGATFVIMGVLLIRGLRRFAVTKTALAVLFVSMVIFSSAAEGIYTVTYVSDAHYVTSAQVPSNVTTISLDVASAGDSINIYFNNDSANVCKIVFLQPYGPVVQNNGVSYYPRHSEDNNNGPSNVFNYTVNKEVVNVTAGADLNNIDVTLNENFRANITAYSYFGDITVHLPSGVNPIQFSNLKSQVGNVKVINS